MGDPTLASADVAEMVLWAPDDAPAEDLDGTVLDWGNFRKATR